MDHDTSCQDRIWWRNSFYVVGLYDQHSFGRLLTIGAQFQKYGDEEPGFVAWVRAPRLKGGKFNLGVEYWDDVRKRTFYDMKGKEQSSLVVRGKTIRGFYQSRHRNLFRSDKIKAGVDLKVRELYDSSVEVFTNPIGDELVHPKIGRSLKALAVLVYDDIDINNYDYDGLRLTSEVGKIFESNLNFNTYRLEGFYYQIVHPINFAAHFEWDVSESRSMADIRFVGGFGSVRGYPDGLERGSKRYYTNVELRYIGLRRGDTQFQFVSFFDFGKAGYSYDDMQKKPIKSYGIGLRIASIRVDRLMLRLDYGISVDENFSGISLGFNQYFQPHKPL